MQLKVKITRYVEDYFPGIVECEFVDSSGHLHTLIEKGPVVSEKWPGPEDAYPTDGIIRCEIIEQWRDTDGRDLLRLTTQRPDFIETTEGVTEFVVLSSQVVSAEATIAELEKKVAACEEKLETELEPTAAALRRDAQAYREWISALKTGHWK